MKDLLHFKVILMLFAAISKGLEPLTLSFVRRTINS